MEFMPGGGSRKAANHVFRTSRPDGLTIGNFSSAMVSLAILGESGVLYDIDKFHYLGSPYSTYHSVFVTPAKTLVSTPSISCAPPPESKSAASQSAFPPTMKGVFSSTCSASRMRCSSLPSAALNSIQQ